MKKLALVLAALFLTAGVVVAQDEAASDISVSASVDYVSTYLFYGMDKYLDDDGAIQPSINIDFDNGFSANIWGSWATEDGHKNSEELRYTVAYAFTAMQDEAWQADFSVNWTYFDVYDGPSNANDSEEIGLMVAFPNLVGDGFVPHYRIVKLWAEEASQQPSVNGWVHIFGFTKTVTTESLLDEGKNQDWIVGADIVYNDSYVINNSEWSHAMFSLAAPMECPMGGKITPSIAYQMTMEENVNTQDEFVFGVNYSVDF